MESMPDNKQFGRRDLHHYNDTMASDIGSRRNVSMASAQWPSVHVNRKAHGDDRHSFKWAQQHAFLVQLK